MNLNEFMTILVWMLNQSFTLGFLGREINYTGNDVLSSFRRLRSEPMQVHKTPISLLRSLTFKDSTPTMDRIESNVIQKWTDLGIDLTEVDISIDSESLIEAIKSLAGAIPYIGIILPTLFDLLHKPTDEVTEIKSQLIAMEGHLFAIENKIGALTKQIKNVAILSYFKSQSEPIGLLQRFYGRYIQETNRVTFNDLQQICTQFNILRYVVYVETELSHSTVMLPPIETMLDGLNLANFQRWMKMLIASISQSMFLHSVCMFTRYENGTDLQNTMNKDIKYFQSVSGLLLRVTQDGTKHIFDNFFKYVKETFVDSFARTHYYSSNEKFASDLYACLQKIYYFRNWFVFSYDPVWTDENHWITSGGSNVYSWFRNYNRNLQITHTNAVMSDELRETYNNAVFQKPEKLRCDYIYKSIANRIGHTFNSIAVLQSTELSTDSYFASFFSAFHATVRADAIMSWNDKFYEVFIVPGDK